MTILYPIVFETEDNGAVSAYVPGLPVYAAADSDAQAERAIRAMLVDYLIAHPASRPGTRVRVARVCDRARPRVSVVGVAALVGSKRSNAKARASRANGRLGGRPPKSASSRAAREQDVALRPRLGTVCRWSLRAVSRTSHHRNDCRRALHRSLTFRLSRAAYAAWPLPGESSPTPPWCFACFASRHSRARNRCVTPRLAGRW
jgi:hypothetical protein